MTFDPNIDTSYLCYLAIHHPKDLSPNVIEYLLSENFSICSCTNSYSALFSLFEANILTQEQLQKFKSNITYKLPGIISDLILFLTEEEVLAQAQAIMSHDPEYNINTSVIFQLLDYFTEEELKVVRNRNINDTK